MLTLIALSAGSLALHEAGHAAVARVFGSPVRLVVNRHGIGVRRRMLARRWQNVACSLAGPVVSLVLMLLFWLAGNGYLAAINAVLAFVNLLPMHESDMTHAWRAVRVQGKP